MSLWNKEVTIIAEIGSNHDGDFGKAIELLDTAVECGADIVKFQSWLADHLVMSSHLEYDLLRRLQMPKEWLPKLMQRCADHGVPFLSTATNETTIEWLEEAGVVGYKLPSGNFNHRPLIDRLIEIGKPVIVSTGVASFDGIVELTDHFNRNGLTEHAILHCISHYPAQPEQMRLRNIPVLRSVLSCPVGFSDHTESIAIPVAAVALGATIVEKHLTLTGQGLSPDHAFSLTPDRFQAMCNGIREAYAGLVCDFTPDREAMSYMLRSLHLARDMAAGEVITAKDIRIIRPDDGLPPGELPKVLGRRLHRNLRADAPLTAVDLETGT